MCFHLLQRLYVTLVLLSLLVQALHVSEGLLQRLAHALVLLRDLEHELLVAGLGFLHLGHFFLQRLDEVEVAGHADKQHSMSHRTRPLQSGAGLPAYLCVMSL